MYSIADIGEVTIVDYSKDSEHFLRMLPLGVQSAAFQGLPDPKAGEDEILEVAVVIAVTFQRHRFRSGRAKGRVVWQADTARIVSAGGAPYVEPDTDRVSTSAWLTNPKTVTDDL